MVRTQRYVFTGLENIPQTDILVKSLTKEKKKKIELFFVSKHKNRNNLHLKKATRFCF